MKISQNSFDICRRRSYRLTGLLGGLTAALGCLFTSFATQFHQLFLSYGIITGFHHLQHVQAWKKWGKKVLFFLIIFLYFLFFLPLPPLRGQPAVIMPTLLTPQQRLTCPCAGWRDAGFKPIQTRDCRFYSLVHYQWATTSPKRQILMHNHSPVVCKNVLI